MPPAQSPMLTYLMEVSYEEARMDAPDSTLDHLGFSLIDPHVLLPAWLWASLCALVARQVQDES